MVVPAWVRARALLRVRTVRPVGALPRQLVFYVPAHLS